jgi:hypothetical protein
VKRSILLILLFCATAAQAAPKERDISAYRALAAQDLRLATIGYRIASANAPFCEEKTRNPGWVLHSYRQYPDRDVARAAFSFPTPVAISAIVPGGPADHAGLKAGLGIYDFNEPGEIWWGGELQVHKPSYELIDNINRSIAQLLATGKPITISFLSNNTAAEKDYQINAQPICASDFWVDSRAKKDAGADGEKIRVTSGLIDFLSNDDELAAVVGHELAHNQLGHPMQTKSRVKRERANEIAADQLSVWLLANAGYDPRAAIRLWQRYGPHKRATPPWRERVSLIEAEIAAMEKTVAEKGLRAPPLLSAAKHQQ